MTKRMLTMLLAAVILLSANGCAPAPDTAENSSSSSVTTEELQVLQDENEKLKQELAELKGESSKTEGEESKEEVETESSAASEPAAKPTTPPTNTQAPVANNNSSSATASKPNNQAAASKPAGNNAQTASSTPAPQKTNNSTGKGPLAKYTVRVKDKTTPAVDVRGRIHEGEAAYVFLSESGEVLGAVPDSNIPLILQQEGLTQAEDDEQKSWFVENFNIYRGLDGGSYEGGSGSTGGGSSSSNEIDIEEFRDEVFRLVNKAREKEGVEPVVSDPTAMEYAQIRAEEISEKFSHVSPDGTVMQYSHYTFAENIAMGGRTPEDAVNSWLNSSGHYATMMGDYSDYGNCMGVGVYEKNGTMYWVLEFIGWDSEA